MGMSTEQVVAIWGSSVFTKKKGQCSENMSFGNFSYKPIGEDCGVSLTEDMWIYGGMWYYSNSGHLASLYRNEKYLFFENDKLVRIEGVDEKDERERREKAIKYFKAHPDRIEFKPFVEKKLLQVGMTSDEVMLSLGGSPNHQNDTHTAFGTSSQWVYGSLEKYNAKYVYLENNVLTSWQD